MILSSIQLRHQPKQLRCDLFLSLVGERVQVDTGPLPQLAFELGDGLPQLAGGGVQRANDSFEGVHGHDVTK
jgi:hypothetical protein